MKTEALLSIRRSPTHLPLSSSLAHILLVYPPAPSSQLSQSLPPKQHALNQLANNEVDFFADLPIISLRVSPNTKCMDICIFKCYYSLFLFSRKGWKKLEVETREYCICGSDMNYCVAECTSIYTNKGGGEYILHEIHLCIIMLENIDCDRQLRLYYCTW